MGQFFCSCKPVFLVTLQQLRLPQNCTSFFSLSKTGVLFAFCTGEAHHHHLIVNSLCVAASCEQGKVALPLLFAEAIALNLLHKYFQYFVFYLLLLGS